MIHYPHHSLSTLYLLNGFEVMETPDGPATQYQRLDELEHCVRRILIRSPKRLRGWDLRFLRRGLELSQTDVGKLVDRDGQTVARWEKTSDELPVFVDLAIRCRFIQRFEPEMTVAELVSYVDGNANPLPSKVLLMLTSEGWQFNLNPPITMVRSKALTTVEIGMPRWPRLAYKVKEISGPMAVIATRNYGLYDLENPRLMFLSEHEHFKPVLTAEQGTSDDHTRVTLQ